MTNVGLSVVLQTILLIVGRRTFSETFLKDNGSPFKKGVCEHGRLCTSQKHTKTEIEKKGGKRWFLSYSIP